MSPRAPYATREVDVGEPPQRRSGFYRTSATGRRTRSGVGPTPRSGGAGKLEPDAGLVGLAKATPAIGHLVDEHQAEPARLQHVGVLVALLRHPAGAPGVADLDVRARVGGARTQPDPLGGGRTSATDAVRHELRDEQEKRGLLLGGDEPAARDGMACL